MIISARKVLAKPTSELWDNLRGNFKLAFDDGEIDATWTLTLLSRYCWKPHEMFPDTPLLKKHYFGNHLKRGFIQPNSFVGTYKSVFWSAHDEYPEVDIRDDLSRLTFEVSNEIYNDMVRKISAFQGSIDMSDLVELINHPRIRAAVDNAAETAAAIDHCYNVALDVIYNDPSVSGNRMVKMMKAGLVKEMQALQLITVLGFMTDVDSSRFQYPVMRGYGAGYSTIYDTAIESRKMAISLSSSQGPLQDTEYQSRTFQLQNMPFRNLHRGDCGSTKYLEMEVTVDQYSEYGVLMHKGNLPNLEGKMYLDEAQVGTVYRPILATDKHLAGRKLKFRSMIAGCQHPDPYGVCSMCYGGLSDTMPYLSNISHVTSSYLMKVFGQGILSLKHSNKSSVIDGIQIDDYLAKYMRAGKGGNTYLFTEEIHKARTVLVLTKAAVPGIVDIEDYDNPEDITLSRVSKLTHVELDVYSEPDEDGVITISHVKLPVSNNKRAASLSSFALDFIRSMDYVVTDKSNYEIDLKDWPLDKPLLVMPLIEYSISEHAKDVAAIIKSSVDEIKRREYIRTPGDVFVELFNLTNSKMDMNAGILEAVLYGGMVVSISGNDYAFPKAWTKATAGVLTDTIAHRSLSGPMCYEGHSVALNDVENFTVTNRLDHPMDVFFVPQEAMATEELNNRH